jgi:hypothetical protein
MSSRRLSIVALLYSASWLSGCAGSAKSSNPSFPVDMDQAQALLDQMHADRKPLARPVVVIGGIYDPGVMSATVAREIRDIATADANVIHITCALDGSFDRCAKRVIDAVDKAFPNYDPERTVEVDAIGFSMSGLVARYAASDESAEKMHRRLNLKRLFTVSTPHQGAKLAVVPTLDQRVIDMRSGSGFLDRLNAEQRSYQLFTYARLGDMVVGEENAAPPGQVAWWLPKTGAPSHILAATDARILADIARRLRGEQPLTTEPAAPLPPKHALAQGS